MCRWKTKALPSQGFGLHQKNFTCSYHEDLLLGFFAACQSSPQRPSVLHRPLRYQFLSPSLRDGIFSRAGSYNMRSFCLRESSSDIRLSHWLTSWQRAIWFSWYLLSSETSLSSWNWIHSLVSLSWAIKSSLCLPMACLLPLVWDVLLL